MSTAHKAKEKYLPQTQTGWHRGTPLVYPSVICIWGGIIFHLDGSRQHGLFAKLTDEIGTYTWSDTSVNTRAFADSPHGGAFNAPLILETHPPGLVPATTACASVSVGNLFDWYLPSRYELYLMYINIGPGAPAPL